MQERLIDRDIQDKQNKGTAFSEILSCTSCPSPLMIFLVYPLAAAAQCHLKGFKCWILKLIRAVPVLTSKAGMLN
jgi:hypothetical protein